MEYVFSMQTKNTMSNETRVLVMWPEAAPYLVGCLKALVAEYNVQLLMIVPKPGNSKAYLDLQGLNKLTFIDLSTSRTWSVDKIKKTIEDFNPDIALIIMQRRGLFAQFAKFVQQMGGLVIGTNDHYWKNSWRDYANAIVSRLGTFKYYDTILVAGALGRLYARRLGFCDNRIFEGLYSCDTVLFRSVGEARFTTDQNRGWPKVFLFVGQYIERKGIITLLDAYSEYRNSSDDPWELWCVGTGPLSGLLKDLPGVKDWGYQSSESCAQLMGKAGAFVLPSLWDHWGVVIHEATCAGLPILATRECGASVELVRSGYNGFTFTANDSKLLSLLFRYISEGQCAAKMGERSLQMSYQIDTKLWAKRLLVDIPFLTRGHSLCAPQ